MSKELTALEALNKLYENYIKKLNYLNKIDEGYCGIWVCEEEAKEHKDIIETALEDYEQCEKTLNHYGLTLVDFREACLLLAMIKGEGRNIHNINNKLKAFETIERVLKEYGLQDYLRITENVEDYPNIEDFYELIRYPENRITSKEQKVLQIIKEKKVDVLELSVCANYETFISFFKLRNWNGEYNSFILTQEEYDLLKEVLLWTIN